MKNKINCFISYSTAGVWEETLEELTSSKLVNRVYLFGPEQAGNLSEGCGFIKTDGRFSTDTIRKIADHSNGAAYSLVITRESKIRFGMLALERFVDLASATGAGMLYSDYFDMGTNVSIWTEDNPDIYGRIGVEEPNGDWFTEVDL